MSDHKRTIVRTIVWVPSDQNSSCSGKSDQKSFCVEGLIRCHFCLENPIRDHFSLDSLIIAQFESGPQPGLKQSCKTYNVYLVGILKKFLSRKIIAKNLEIRRFLL